MKNNKSINSVGKYLIKHCRPILPLASTAALVAITGIASPAKALTFNWQFTMDGGNPLQSGVVTGTISGLNDNQAFQTSGLTVSITSAPNTPAGGWATNWSYVNGSGFSVANGQITSYNAYFTGLNVQSLYFGDNTGGYGPQLVDNSTNEDNGSQIDGYTFTPAAPAASVPGPLPILGAASAFGWSRRVRKRLRAAQPASQA